MTYEQRRDLLLKTMIKQTDHWLKEDQYVEWEKKNKPKHSYTFIPKRNKLYFNGEFVHRRI